MFFESNFLASNFGLVSYLFLCKFVLEDKDAEEAHGVEFLGKRLLLDEMLLLWTSKLFKLIANVNCGTNLWLLTVPKWYLSCSKDKNLILLEDLKKK